MNKMHSICCVGLEPKLGVGLRKSCMLMNQEMDMRFYFMSTYWLPCIVVVKNGMSAMQTLGLDHGPGSPTIHNYVYFSFSSISSSTWIRWCRKSYWRLVSGPYFCSCIYVLDDKYSYGNTQTEWERTKCSAAFSVITYPLVTFAIVLTRYFYWMHEFLTA